MSQEDLLTRVTPVPLDEIEDTNPIIPKRKHWLVPTLYRIQKYSAYSFISFLGIHATSVILVPILPIDQLIKDEVFAMAKEVYQSVPLYEPICIIGSVAAHVMAGISIRIYKKCFQKKPLHRINNGRHSPITNKLEDHDDEIGFGGISNLFGLGYRKSFTVQFGLTPLQFSGYVLIPFFIYHMYKFRYIPCINDGDSSLINLEYISYVLNLKHPMWNVFALGTLIYSMSYHGTNGLMKLKGKYSKTWKKIGLAVVNGVSLLGWISVYLFKCNVEVIDVNGFLGKSFTKYLRSFWL